MNGIKNVLLSTTVVQGTICTPLKMSECIFDREQSLKIRKGWHFLGSPQNVSIILDLYIIIGWNTKVQNFTPLTRNAEKYSFSIILCI